MSRRGRAGLRNRLTRSLVGVALTSVLLLSGVNYVFARWLIDDSVEAQLETLRDSRVAAVERGMARLRSNVSNLAANPSVVDALAELSTEYDRLDAVPADSGDAADRDARLEALYADEILPAVVAAGIDPGLPADLVPASRAGRYVQYHYIVENPDGFDERDRLDDAGDGSGYSGAHATHHPLLRELMVNASMSDLLLVDIDSREVVYSTKKRIDVGTDAVAGPYGDSGLGAVLDDLTRVAAGETAVSDSSFYLPTRGSPVFFLAAAVRSDTEVIGAVVTEMPADVLTAVITADQNWDLLGLGDTGETYVVGADGTLRTNSRRWSEDPETYLERVRDRYDDATADAIEAVGSPVLVQPVDNRAVAAGLDGDEFIGTVDNYLGVRTLTASAPVAFGELDWVVVAEQARSETDSALDSYARRILLVLAVLLPLVAVLAALLARNLTRPVNTLVLAADRIAAGESDVVIDDLGRNELGDLGRQIDGVARQLEGREQEILEEERHIGEVLTAVLPARLVERVRRGEGTVDDVFDTATVISITLDELPEGAGFDQDVVWEIGERLNDGVEELMERHGVDRVRRSAGTQLFIAGLDHDDPRADDAVAFARAAIERVAALGREFERHITAHAGLSAGEVATGVLGGTQLTFGVWGDPPTAAQAIDSLAQPGQILVDDSVAELLGTEWVVGPSERLPGLAEDIDVHDVRRSPVDG